jgi:hypothetical protein
VSTSCSLYVARHQAVLLCLPAAPCTLTGIRQCCCVYLLLPVRCQASGSAAVSTRCSLYVTRYQAVLLCPRCTLYVTRYQAVLLCLPAACCVLSGIRQCCCVYPLLPVGYQVPGSAAVSTSCSLYVTRQQAVLLCLHCWKS